MYVGVGETGTKVRDTYRQYRALLASIKVRMTMSGVAWIARPQLILRHSMCGW